MCPSPEPTPLLSCLQDCQHGAQLGAQEHPCDEGIRSRCISSMNLLRPAEWVLSECSRLQEESEVGVEELRESIEEITVLLFSVQNTLFVLVL